MKPTLKQWLQVAKNFIIELPLEILQFLVVPIALLFCGKESEKLPRWAAWFDDPDYGINGDDGWRGEHFPNGKNRTYWARLCWLYRNRIGVFSAKYLGVRVENIDANTVRTQGDALATYNKVQKNTQCLVTFKLKDGAERFGYYREIRYKGFLSGFYCRIYVGWKLMDVVGMRKDNKHTYMDENDKKVLQTVWAINPFKRIKE